MSLARLIGLWLHFWLKGNESNSGFRMGLSVPGIYLSGERLRCSRQATGFFGEKKYIITLVFHE